MNNTITLDTPLKRGDNEITAVTINKPNSGALRGTSLRGLLDFETNDIIKVLPRITEPALTEQEAARLDPADLVQMGMVISGFLLTKQVKQDSGLMPDSLPA